MEERLFPFMIFEQYSLDDLWLENYCESSCRTDDYDFSVSVLQNIFFKFARLHFEDKLYTFF